MLKSLALIVLLAVTGIRDTGKKNDGSNLAENNGDNKASPTSTVINNQACPPDKDGTSAQSPSWYVSPEWWLCILGVPTLLFIGWQAKATANAAKSVEKQTKELAIQNRNMVARERARISLHSVSKPQILDDLTFANIIKITIYVVNAGSSTAFNVKALGTMNIVEIDDEEEETVNAAIDPEDWYDLEIPKIISPTEDGNPISITIDRVGGLIRVDLVIIRTSLIEEIRDRAKSILIGGEISYEDLFGEEHKTPFLYVWVNRGDETDHVWRERASWLDLSGKST